MQPISDERLAGEGLGLRDLIFVMRKDEIDSAGVNVERLAQILHGHHGTLDVPARAAHAEAFVPARLAILLSFPQNEVASVGLIVFVDIDARAGADAAE